MIDKFDKETLEKMKSTLKETKDNEMAFVLCKGSDGRISYGRPTCVGSWCEVNSSESKCKSGDEDIGSFHTHIDNSGPSVRDLISTFDQDIMCVGRKSLIPFHKHIECYAAIDKKKKPYAISLVEDYDKTYYGIIRKIVEKKMTIPQANLIKETEYDKTINNLLPLLHKFKV